MKSKLITIPLIFLLFVTVSPQLIAKQFTKDKYDYYQKDTPAWVSFNEYSNKISSKNQSESSYLLVDQQTHFSQETQFYSRFVQKLNTPTSVENNSQITFDFDPKYEQLIIHSINIVRNGKKTSKFDPSTVIFVQQEKQLNRLMYVGTVSALFVLDDVRTGDILDYSYSILGRNPVYGDRFFSTALLGWGVDVQKQFLKFRVPSNRKLTYKTLKNHVKVVENRTDKYIDYIWKSEDIPAIFFEDFTPNNFKPAPLMLVSEFKNWGEVSQWALTLYEQDKSLSKELKGLIENWKLTKPTKNEYTLAALRFVQDEIRYFGVEFGKNSHMPSHPNDVIKRRFGDCKDKSLALVTILNEAGIDASMALVSYENRDGISELLPSPDAFDHVIVKAEIDGKTIWLDPTRTLQRGPLSSTPITPFGSALIVNKSTTALTRIVPNTQSHALSIITEDINATDFWQPANLTVTTKFYGEEAESKRHKFANESVEKISRQYFEFYSKFYTGLRKAENVTFIDDDKKNILTTIEKYQIPNFWKFDSEGAWFNSYGYSIKDHTYLPKILQRKMPLAIRHSREVIHNFNVTFPSSLTGFLAVKPVSIEDKSIAFHRKASIEKNTYKIQYNYLSKNNMVETGDIPTHITNLKRINKSLDISPLNNFEKNELNKIMTNRLMERI